MKLLWEGLNDKTELIRIILAADNLPNRIPYSDRKPTIQRDFVSKEVHSLFFSL